MQTEIKTQWGFPFLRSALSLLAGADGETAKAIEALGWVAWNSAWEARPYFEHPNYKIEHASAAMEKVLLGFLSRNFGELDPTLTKYDGNGYATHYTVGGELVAVNRRLAFEKETGTLCN